MRTLITTLVVLIAGACSGNAPAKIDSGRACDNRLYDPCLQEHDCASGNCRNSADGSEVCSMACTVGNDTTCGTTSDGRPATCVMGFCKPPGPNDCILSH